MATQVHFTISDALHADLYEVARELGLSVNQYARLVFLSHRYMSAAEVQQARYDDLDRQEKERRERESIRQKQGRGVRRVDGGGWG